MPHENCNHLTGKAASEHHAKIQRACDSLNEIALHSPVIRVAIIQQAHYYLKEYQSSHVILGQDGWVRTRNLHGVLDFISKLDAWANDGTIIGQGMLKLSNSLVKLTTCEVSDGQSAYGLWIWLTDFLKLGSPLTTSQVKKAVASINSQVVASCIHELSISRSDNFLSYKPFVYQILLGLEHGTLRNSNPIMSLRSLMQQAAELVATKLDKHICNEFSSFPSLIQDTICRRLVKGGPTHDIVTSNDYIAAFLDIRYTDKAKHPLKCDRFGYCNIPAMFRPWSTIFDNTRKLDRKFPIASYDVMRFGIRPDNWKPKSDAEWVAGVRSPMSMNDDVKELKDRPGDYFRGE